MPIKPENAHRYPADWPEVRERILRRAGWRCEHPGCRAAQYAVGRWINWDDGPLQWKPLEGNDRPKTRTDREMDAAGQGTDLHGQRWSYGAARAFIGRFAWPDDERYIVIVLTIAHLDHQPENCADDNLRAMCQRHHLAHDQLHHIATARATRRARLALGELF